MINFGPREDPKVWDIIGIYQVRQRKMSNVVKSWYNGAQEITNILGNVLTENENI